MRRISVDEFEELCAPGAPVSGRQAAPAQGLCLMEVRHDPCPFDSSRGEEPRSAEPGVYHPFARL
jgi:hypothetical protein